MSMLKVENLSVHYGMIQAVRDVSFEVNEGEVVSLIGANGAGKTSILRTISGLVRPSAGKIEFLGQEIQKVPAQKIVAAGLSQVQWVVPSCRRQNFCSWMNLLWDWPQSLSKKSLISSKISKNKEQLFS